MVRLWLLWGVGEPATQAPPSPETEVAPEPRLPTGVHLQATFAVPVILDGQPTIHKEMRYLLHLPTGYDQAPDSLWPLILFLHGSDGGR